MEIYEKLKELAGNGAKVRADFKNRTLTINGKFQKLEPPFDIPHPDNLEEWLDKVEDLYDDFKYSRPTKSSMNYERRCKFKGLSAAQLVANLGKDALNAPITRDEALVALEAFIVLSLVDGSFKPEELFAKDWYFQGTDKSLILYKNWF